MNKKVRNCLLIVASLLMIVFCVALGNGKANVVNKSEVNSAKASAASMEPDTTRYMQENTELGTYGDVLMSTQEPLYASETDAEQVEDFAVDEVDSFMAGMSTEDKVAQLFFITPDALTGTEGVTMAGDATKSAIEDIPVGGIIYMGDNLQSHTQVKEMLSNTNTYSMDRVGLPMFMTVDEEGGTVARIAGSGRFGVKDVGNMADIGATGTVDDARQAGASIGNYLSDLGFNIDFAPVADVLSNSENSIVKYRSFGSDPEKVSEMSVAVADGLKSEGIDAVYKHFPGHGATAGDTHVGAAFTNKTYEELAADELVPFQNAIDNGAKYIMVAHISAPNLTGHDTPASLSDIVVTDILRDKMGYDGLVITDAMHMGAISSKYSSDEAAVMAIQAGVDIILMPEDFHKAYEGVLSAVNSGEISEDRLNESVRRILEVKLEME